MGSLSFFRKAPSNKCFGVEIECVPRVPTRTDSYLGMFYVTGDSSLQNWNAVEFISQPMPYDMLRTHIIKLNKKVGGWVPDRNAGLHIHVSRSAWPKARYEPFWEFLTTLSSVQLITLFGRESRYASTNPGILSGDKFRAVNLCHEKSIELRLWAAGDVTWTLEALRRTKLIVEYRGVWTYDNALELFTKPE